MCGSPEHMVGPAEVGPEPTVTGHLRTSAEQKEEATRARLGPQCSQRFPSGWELGVAWGCWRPSASAGPEASPGNP